MEKRGLAWKRGDWRGRDGIVVEERELEWKRGDWRGREGIVVEDGVDVEEREL